MLGDKQACGRKKYECTIGQLTPVPTYWQKTEDE
jgi:hypothetical protein